MTMKASKLRIGNWCYSTCKGRDEQVQKNHFTGFQKEDNEGFYIENCLKPIPLTEEWLERSNHNNEEWMLTNPISEQEETDYNTWEIRRAYTDENGSTQWVYYCDVFYVHDWQNFHFALTGTELTFDK